MRLFRVFDWDSRSLGQSEGGPLFVARARQGAGRHDNPARYGAWYSAREAVSAIAEAIQPFRGRRLEDGDLVRAGGLVQAAVTLEFDDREDLVDLDDASGLVARQLRPSYVATLRRSVTQGLAASIFRDGAVGMSWWSTLNADWTNVTLFHERALSRTRVLAPPVRLSIEHPDLHEAAAVLGIEL